LGLDLQEPVLRRGNAAQIFPNMLLAQIADWHFVSVAIYDGDTEQFLRQENTLGMMS
jgi:hypothetical protein